MRLFSASSVRSIITRSSISSSKSPSSSSSVFSHHHNHSIRSYSTPFVEAGSSATADNRLSLFSKYVESVKHSVPAMNPELLHKVLVTVPQTDKYPSELVLLDVREPYEWNEQRIPFAQYIGRGTLERSILSMVPDVNSVIVLYCTNATRSVLAAHNLIEMGYKNVSYLDGGIAKWKALYTAEPNVSWQDKHAGALL